MLWRGWIPAQRRGYNMTHKAKIAVDKIRVGAWLILRGIPCHQEYISHGFAIFGRGIAELLGVHRV